MKGDVNRDSRIEGSKFQRYLAHYHYLIPWRKIEAHEIGIYEYPGIKHLKEVETSKINRYNTIKRLFLFFYKSMKPETMCP